MAGPVGLPVKVVSCYRDPQLQVGENYLYLFIYSFANLDVKTLILFPLTVI